MSRKRTIFSLLCVQFPPIWLMSLLTLLLVLNFFLFIFSLFRVTFSQAENITGAHYATVVLILRLIYIFPAGTIRI
jgi:hypothetical protein